MKSIIAAVACVAALTPICATAGQTGAFVTAKNTLWACEDEQAIARIMTKRSTAEMRAEADRSGRCLRLAAGTTIWVHGGNALIEWGGIDGYPEALYYPAAGVTYE